MSPSPYPSHPANAQSPTHELILFSGFGLQPYFELRSCGLRISTFFATGFVRVTPPPRCSQLQPVAASCSQLQPVAACCA